MGESKRRFEGITRAQLRTPLVPTLLHGVRHVPRRRGAEQRAQERNGHRLVAESGCSVQERLEGLRLVGEEACEGCYVGDGVEGADEEGGDAHERCCWVLVGWLVLGGWGGR